MKPSQVDKLYSKLTPLELGTMAFDALARLDEEYINSFSGILNTRD
jgi:hypothetical protein